MELLAVLLFGSTALIVLTYPIFIRLFFLKQGITQGPPPLRSISMVVPVSGIPHQFEKNVLSWLAQDPSQLRQVIICVERQDDPVVEVVQQMIQHYEDGRLLLVITGFDPESLGKMNNLLGGLPHATGDILALVDADAFFHRPDYLSDFVKPLSRDDVGLVSCYPAYRDTRSLGSAIIGFGINLELLPKIAQRAVLTGHQTNAVGTTLAIRRETMDELGGLEFLRKQLLMDVKLALAVSKLGLNVHLFPEAVGVHASDVSVRNAWRQAKRWGLGIHRVIPTTFFISYCIQRGLLSATVFAPLLYLISPVIGATAFITLGVRIGVAAFNNHRYIKDRSFWKWCWFLPAFDLIMTTCALCSFFSNTFVWNGRRYKLGPGAVASPQA